MEFSFKRVEIKNHDYPSERTIETKPSRMHVLCDDARMLGNDVIRVCSCCNLHVRGTIWSTKIDALAVPKLSLNSVCTKTAFY